MARLPTLGHEIDDLRTLGHSALAFMNVAIVLTIIAVILSTKSGTPQVITQAFSFLTWLVKQILTPVSGGTSVQLSATPAGVGTVPVTAANIDSGSWDLGSSSAGTTDQASIDISASTPGVTTGSGAVWTQ